MKRDTEFDIGVVVIAHEELWNMVLQWGVQENLVLTCIPNGLDEDGQPAYTDDYPLFAFMPESVPADDLIELSPNVHQVVGRPWRIAKGTGGWFAIHHDKHREIPKDTFATRAEALKWTQEHD